MSTPADLLAALRGVPRLPGAACRDRWTLFDPPDPHTHPEDIAYIQAAALRLCRTCPALASCGLWFDSLPPTQRPQGVIAGRICS